MIKYNPKNERIKKSYLTYAKEADQKCDRTIDGIRKAILRFETFTEFKDFKTFNADQSIEFKKYLTRTTTQRTSKPLGKSVMLSTINALKDFFKWLGCQPGYKSCIHMPDIQYFNLSAKDTRMARETKFKLFPTIEQIRKVVESMPCNTEIEKRDRALIAFTLLTGMRDGAIASLCLKHIDLDHELVMQDPTEVKTKFSKRIDTYFFPVGDDFKEIVKDWVRYLREIKIYGNTDPVFPRTKLGQDKNQSFVSQGLENKHWSSATKIRQIFRSAFQNANLPYYNPHSFRDTLSQFGKKNCSTAEEYKAWSQNFGHEQMMTTFTYGQIDTHRQGEIVKGMLRKKEEQVAMQQDLQEIKKLLSEKKLLSRD